MPQTARPSSPIILTFAVSDPTGGSGLQADLLTMAALGVHPLSVITGLWLQDTATIEDGNAIDSDWVVDQARILLEDIPVQAFKIGELNSVENVAAVAEVIADYPNLPVVFDPSLTAPQSADFTDEEMIAAICELLLPLTTVLTLSSTKARRLAQAQDEDDDGELSLPDCAQYLIGQGVEHVLITGLHEQTPQVLNTLYSIGGIERADAWERLPSHYHGAGSTLSSAIAALLAHGQSVPEAVRAAQEFTWQTLLHAQRIGMGQLIPQRFFARTIT